MLPNTNLQYCIIALYVLLKLFGLQMGDWPIEGGGGVGGFRIYAWPWLWFMNLIYAIVVAAKRVSILFD